MSPSVVAMSFKGVQTQVTTSTLPIETWLTCPSHGLRMRQPIASSHYIV